MVTDVAGGDEVVGSGGERLTKVDQSPLRRPPVDRTLRRESELVGKWTERWTLMKAVAPREPTWPVGMK